MNSLFACFTRNPDDEPLNPLDPRKKSCQFCNVSVKNGFDVVWENELFVAFLDRKPASLHHIQLIPKAHINSVKALRTSDVELVKSMAEIGHKILDNHHVPPETRRMGFHIPPFNSVNHLHLHVQGLPYNSLDRQAKYRISPGRKRHDKGFSWFVEVGQAIRILEQGHRIGVFPC